MSEKTTSLNGVFVASNWSLCCAMVGKLSATPLSVIWAVPSGCNSYPKLVNCTFTSVCCDKKPKSASVVVCFWSSDSTLVMRASKRMSCWMVDGSNAASVFWSVSLFFAIELRRKPWYPNAETAATIDPMKTSIAIKKMKIPSVAEEPCTGPVIGFFGMKEGCVGGISIVLVHSIPFYFASTARNPHLLREKEKPAQQYCAGAGLRIDFIQCLH